jgi:hypothetical protein
MVSNETRSEKVGQNFKRASLLGASGNNRPVFCAKKKKTGSSEETESSKGNPSSAGGVLLFPLGEAHHENFDGFSPAAPKQGTASLGGRSGGIQVIDKQYFPPGHADPFVPLKMTPDFLSLFEGGGRLFDIIDFDDGMKKRKTKGPKHQLHVVETSDLIFPFVTRGRHKAIPRIKKAEKWGLTAKEHVRQLNVAASFVLIKEIPDRIIVKIKRPNRHAIRFPFAQGRAKALETIVANHVFPHEKPRPTNGGYFLKTHLTERCCRIEFLGWRSASAR